MTQACAWFVGMWVAIFCVGSAHAQSSDEMLRACEMLERGMHVEGGTVYIPPSAQSNQCWGFIEAVQEYAVLADQEGRTLLDACPDPNATTVLILHTFTHYANTHPDTLKMSAAAVAYKAMVDAFPCAEPSTGH